MGFLSLNKEVIDFLESNVESAEEKEKGYTQISYKLIEVLFTWFYVSYSLFALSFFFFFEFFILPTFLFLSNFSEEIVLQSEITKSTTSLQLGYQMVHSLAQKKDGEMENLVTWTLNMINSPNQKSHLDSSLRKVAFPPAVPRSLGDPKTNNNL